MNIQDTDLQTWQIALICLAAIWEITWKGFALWRAARNGHTGWFVVLLFINTVGVLPIIYLLLNKKATVSK